MELLCRAPARDQRVIPGFATERLKFAVPALQAIGTVFAIDVLMVALARDERVIPAIAIEQLTKAVPAL